MRIRETVEAELAEAVKYRASFHADGDLDNWRRFGIAVWHLQNELGTIISKEKEAGK